MAKERPIFSVIVNYPLPENEEEYEKKIAKAVAKILSEIIPPEKIDELIEMYKIKNR